MGCTLVVSVDGLIYVLYIQPTKFSCFYFLGCIAEPLVTSPEILSALYIITFWLKLTEPIKMVLLRPCVCTNLLLLSHPAIFQSSSHCTSTQL